MKIQIACIMKRRQNIEQLMAREEPKLIEAASVKSEFQQLASNQDNLPAQEPDWQQLYNKLRRFFNLQPVNGKRCVTPTLLGLRRSG